MLKLQLCGGKFVSVSKFYILARIRSVYYDVKLGTFFFSPCNSSISSFCNREAISQKQKMREMMVPSLRMRITYT
jgi:hypothetical protein